MPGGVSAHPAPFFVKVRLAIRLRGVERQHPIGRRIRRPQHRGHGLEAPGAQGKEHVLQGLQGLVDARGLLMPTALAVDAQLLGQPVGDRGGILVGSDGGDTRIP